MLADERLAGGVAYVGGIFGDQVGEISSACRRSRRLRSVRVGNVCRQHFGIEPAGWFVSKQLDSWAVDLQPVVTTTNGVYQSKRRAGEVYRCVLRPLASSVPTPIVRQASLRAARNRFGDEEEPLAVGTGMDLYPVWLLLIGLACFGAAWLPHVLEGKALSYPILYIGLGALVFVVPFGLDMGDPIVHSEAVERVTEILVVISLMGCGLKIVRPVGWVSWSPTWRLLGITMPLCIVGLTAAAWLFAGLEFASALLLAACLAPTDPVLASEVQAPPPGEKDRSDIRFALTSESGLNDGLAFPFVRLAIAVTLWMADDALQMSLDQTLLRWFAYACVYKIVVGVLMGVLAGWIAARLIFWGGQRRTIANYGDGLAAIALALIVYGATELARGYGFVAVFVAAVTLRQFERRHDYHRQLHEATELIERLMTATALVLFGGMLVEGLLAGLTWRSASIGIAFVLLWRPATGMLGLLGSEMKFRERLATSFFGIRGVGSFYYLAYAAGHAKFSQSSEIWALVAFTALCSIVIHGIAAAPGMRWADPIGESQDNEATKRE